MSDIKWENAHLKGLDLFNHLLNGYMPHKAIEIMINNNQDVDDVKMYFKAMLKHIKSYERKR